MKYRFSRLWARVLVVVGVLIVVLGVLLGILSVFTDQSATGMASKDDVLSRAVVAVILIVSGLLVGGPLIVTGQLLEIFLDQRRLLARIHRSLRSALARNEPDSPVRSSTRREGA